MQFVAPKPENIRDYGVDFDLSRGWEGIWVRGEIIYGGKFRLEPSAETNYLMVYYDPLRLLYGLGFYDEGAFDFTKLVIAGRTLQDLLAEGGVLKVVTAEG